METQTAQNPPKEKFSFGTIFKDLGSSAKSVMRSEIDLAIAEMQNNVNTITTNCAKAAFFGMLAALSIVPFMAFLVVGLGQALDGRYWLSSLIVSIVFAIGFGIPANRAYKAVMAPKFGFPKVKQSIAAQRKAMQEQMDNLSDTVRRVV
jgi:hypothetical protein